MSWHLLTRANAYSVDHLHFTPLFYAGAALLRNTTVSANPPPRHHVIQHNRLLGGFQQLIDAQILTQASTMASAKSAIRDIPSDDELDDILNGIVDGEDVFDTSNIQPRQEQDKQQNPDTATAGLGIDEEIKIIKKRQPIPKLDENRSIYLTMTLCLLKCTKVQQVTFVGWHNQASEDF
jgi:hypothetical protein